MGCYNSKIINAPVDKVWAAVRNFNALPWAKGVIESCEVLGDKRGDQLGTRRKLNGAFVETLLGLDDNTRTIRYSIDEGPGPMENCSGYIGTVQLHELTDGDRTFIAWSSTWADSQGGVKELCDPIYQALLSAMADNL